MKLTVFFVDQDGVAGAFLFEDGLIGLEGALCSTHGATTSLM